MSNVDLDQDPRKVALRIQEEIDSFRAAHQQVISVLQELEAQITPAQTETYTHVREVILASYRDTRLMGVLLEEVGEYIKLLLAQRRSSREMFLAGGNAVVTDLLALATGPEYVQLRRLLQQVAGDGSLPF